MTLVFKTVDPESEPAQQLLADYFADRKKTFPPELGSYSPKAAPAAQLRAPNGEFLLAHLDGAAVGCGGIRRIAAADDGAATFEIKHVFVSEAARGAGLGRELIERLEDAARRLGGQRIVLDTNRSQRAAGRLYLRLGYHEVPAFNDNRNANAWYAKTL